jgi:hypothetical protein
MVSPATIAISIASFTIDRQGARCAAARAATS